MPLATSNLLSSTPLQAALANKLNLAPLSMSTANSTSSLPFKAPAPIGAPAQPYAGAGNTLYNMSISDYQALVARNRAKQAAAAAAPAPAALPVKTVGAPAGTTAGLGGLSLVNPNAGMFGGNQAPSQVITASTPQATATVPSTFPGLIGGIAAAGQGNEAIGKSAAEIAADYGKKIADVGQKGADAAAGYATTGTSPVGEGNAAVVKQTAAAEQSALAQGESAALQGTGQQLTAQGQEASAYGAAGGLVKPEVGSYGQTFYNPLTGTSLGNGEFSSALDLYGKMAASGQFGAIPAAITGNPVLNAEVLDRARAINPNFNYNTALGAGGAQQSLAQTGGTAEQQANVGIYQKALDSVATLTNQLGNVDQLGNLLVTTASSGGINPSNVRYANQTIAQIRSQLSSAEQAQFDSTLATLQGKISGLLSVGGDQIPTTVSANASKVLDGSLALSALPSVLGQIQTEGQIILKNQSDIASKAFTNIQGGGTSSAGGGAGSTTAGGYSFKLVNGQWVPA